MAPQHIGSPASHPRGPPTHLAATDMLAPRATRQHMRHHKQARARGWMPTLGRRGCVAKPSKQSRVAHHTAQSCAKHRDILPLKVVLLYIQKLLSAAIQNTMACPN